MGIKKEYPQFLRWEAWVCIVQYFVLGMKYKCRSCLKTCDDMIEHIRKEHGFSESYIRDSLKTNTNSYKNSFEKIA